MGTIDLAITVASTAHAGQVDKGGNPYILHPLRVGMGFKDEVYMVTGILHDVIEDTPLEVEDLLRLGFGTTVVMAVDSLSRREGESWSLYLTRVASNPIGREVKIADLWDNMDLSRLVEVTDTDLARNKLYSKAIERLRKMDD